MDEYYILCPKKPAGEGVLIQHLISKDICEERQDEGYHKCPSCVRSRMWQESHPAGAVSADGSVEV